MKKIILIASIIIAGISATSCESDITALNVDPKKPQVLPSETLVASAQQVMLDQFLTPSVNRNITRMFVQQWTQTTYTDESNYDMNTRPIPRNHYNYVMATSSAAANSPGILPALRDAKNFLAAEPEEATTKANKAAIIEVLSVYSWANLVDTYGNIPYFEAMKAPAIIQPKYDDGMAIYQDLIKRLDAAIAGINTGVGSYSNEIFYQGNMTQWKKAANSLKFRLGVTLSDVNYTLAKSTAESAYNSGLFTSNADNLGLKAFPAGQFSNPVYQDVVQSGRNDYVPTALIVDMMNAKADPRREYYFTKIGGVYKGGVYGSNNNFFAYSHMTSSKPGDAGAGGYMLISETAPGFLLDYAEIMFLRAEAAARGMVVGGTPADLYAKAITASMDQYGIASAAPAYILANPYNATNWKKSIGEEAWVAMFNRGFQAWNFSRRLDNPVFTNPSSSTVESVPVRMKYSDQEYVLNKANVTAAATAIGGDKVSTKVFWDKF